MKLNTKIYFLLFGVKVVWADLAAFGLSLALRDSPVAGGKFLPHMVGGLRKVRSV